MSEFERNIIDIFGSAGKTWLKELPELVEKFKMNWNLGQVTLFSNLTYSYVGRTVCDGRHAVLKMMPPCDRLTRECEWYRNQGGRGCPELIACDTASGALLIQRMQPATSAKYLVVKGQDREATQAIAVSVLGLQHQPVFAGKFPHVRDFVQDLEGLKSCVPQTFLEKAQSLLRELTRDPSEDVLLHGDLHHDNVVKHGGQWVAIDPHGYIGPPAFEVGAMMRNPFDCFPSAAPLEEIISVRTGILEQHLPYSRREIQAWSLIYTLVSSSWSLADHGEIPDEHMQIAGLLSRQLDNY